MLAFFANLITSFFRGWLGDKRAARAQKDLGRSEAIVRGQERAAEIADEQAEAAANPPTDDALLDELRRGGRL